MNAIQSYKSQMYNTIYSNIQIDILSVGLKFQTGCNNRIYTPKQFHRFLEFVENNIYYLFLIAAATAH